MNLLQLIWPDGAFLRGHVSIPDWLSWNQNSVFESQSEIDTWQGRNLQKLQVVEEQASWRGAFLLAGGWGAFWQGGFFRKVEGFFLRGFFPLMRGKELSGAVFSENGISRE